MKRFNYILLLAVLVPSLLSTSCKDDETVDANAFETLQTYMLAQNMDLDHIIKYHDATSNADIKFVTPPPADADLDAFLAKYYIIDIRSAASFADGHLEGAQNVAPNDKDLSGVLTKASEAGDKPILVVCYTGQTACFVTSCLRMYGYRDAQALKWGMSGWNAEFDSWTGNVKNDANGHDNWSFESAPANGINEYPVINSNLTDGEAILKAQVEAVLAAGFKGVVAKDVLDNPTNYQVNNYYSEGHYLGFGHIDGAFRVNPLNFAENTIKALNPAEDVVTYCYTGQTSAVITAYLRVLGYNAFSLKFGMNALWNENPFWVDPEIKNQWGFDSKPKSLPTVK